MKKHVIRSIFCYLMAALALFGFKILVAYFVSNDLNVLKELDETIFDSIILLPIYFFLRRKQKSEKEKNNTDKTE